MTNWQYPLLSAVGALLLLALARRSSRRRKRNRDRDFTRSLETLLQPKETVKIICPQKGGRCILTNKRVIFEKKGDFSAVPLKSVQKVQGINEAGNRTTVPAKMTSLTIHADREYTLKNTGEEFCDLVKALSDKVKKQNERAKAKKEGKACKKEEKS